MSTARSARFWHDLVHGVLHFEGKIWRTLPLLAWRPGELTRRYVHGERARFVSPIALFLFSVFLMFAVLSTDRRAMSDLPRHAAARAAGSLEAARADRSAELGRRARRDRRGAAARATAKDAAAAGSRAPASSMPRSRRPQERASRRSIASSAPDGTASRRPRDRSNRLAAARPGHRESAARIPSLLLYKLQTNAYKFSWR